MTQISYASWNKIRNGRERRSALHKDFIMFDRRKRSAVHREVELPPAKATQEIIKRHLIIVQKWWRNIQIDREKKFISSTEITYRHLSIALHRSVLNQNQVFAV